MSIDYGAVTALAAVVASIAAVVAIWIEGKRARFSQGLDILLRLGDQFNSASFVSKRRALAKLLASQERLSPLDQEERKRLSDEILDFFEMVGLFLKKKILDPELVHAEFFYWLYHYYALTKDHLAEFRRASNDNTVWEDAEWLYYTLLEVEGSPPTITSSMAGINRFLQEESSL